MKSAHLTYDKHSGRIIGMHHGTEDVAHALERAHHHCKIAKEQIAVMTVDSGAFKRGKQYKVDVSRKALVETAAGEAGTFFSSGQSAHSS